MRFLLKLKFFALVAIWTLICLALYVVLALIEARRRSGSARLAPPWARGRLWSTPSILAATSSSGCWASSG